VIAGATEPPFLRLAGHPLRWQLLSELARSDRRVGELCELTGERQNLVSYHLRQLRGGGLVWARRSIADGRDTYYALDLERCAQSLAGVGGSLHPALAGRQVAGPDDVSPISTRAGRTPRLLFVCTGNSARSQMAEALALHLSGGTVEAASAGISPKQLHPSAVRVMRRRGLDIAGSRAKHISELEGQRFDRMITLCDRARENCPEFPDAIHWSTPDPAAESGMEAFERVAAELETRIAYLLKSIDHDSEVTANAG
jgi:ArsR family transcriptional regulator, arsenate/arsenite/antimonite-responsive transcriptional repressor / arsenate reductase (thioredoxin)